MTLKRLLHALGVGCVLVFLLMLSLFGASKDRPRNSRLFVKPMRIKTYAPPKVLTANASYVTGFVGIGRLGNNMFVYASTFAVARRHNLTVGFGLSDWTLEAYRAMQSVFQLSSDPYNGSYVVDKNIVEKGWGIYNVDVDDRKCFGNRTLLLHYLQSFKYFLGYESAIKAEFALTEKFSLIAQKFLMHVAAGRPNVTFVGVHVRRGDMVGHRLYNVAPPEYIVKAMDYFERKYGDRSAVQFIVASDDVDWTSKSLAVNWKKTNVAYASKTTEGDMAILSRCNHSVITSGTYGWWAGWLTGGEVVYYSEFMPQTSPLANGYAVSDYYPSSWKGMT